MKTQIKIAVSARPFPGLRLLSVLAIGVVVTACAAPDGPRNVQPEDLRKSTHFITERLFSDLDFPTLQRNLFKHRDACGSAPRFVMHEMETGYASLIETAEIPESYENVVMMDLIQYPESWRSPKRVALRAYSYYYNDDVQRRVDRMLAVVQQPGVCQPENQ